MVHTFSFGSFAVSWSRRSWKKKTWGSEMTVQELVLFFTILDLFESSFIFLYPGSFMCVRGQGLFKYQPREVLFFCFCLKYSFPGLPATHPPQQSSGLVGLSWVLAVLFGSSQWLCCGPFWTPLIYSFCQVWNFMNISNNNHNKLEHRITTGIISKKHN